jgi:RHS repeat-associated protein
MSTARRPETRLQAAAVVVIAFLVVACGSNPAPSPVASSAAPSPSTPVTAPPASPSSSPSASPEATATGDLALEACDLTGYVPCQHQAVLLSQPVAGTGVALTYSSEWAPGRKDRTGWDAAGLGLGGWALDVLQRYDPTAGVLLSGDGSWRLAKGIVLPSGERAIPTYDGLQAYVFDAAGRHVRTVDALLGTTLVTFAYDTAGRLSGADGSLGGTPIHLIIERATDGTPSNLVGAGGAKTSLLLGDGNLEWIRDPAGRATGMSVQGGGLVNILYDATGGVTSYGYDDAGRLASTTDPDGVVVTYARTATAESVEVRSTTALGRVSTYRSERSATGRVQAYAAPDGTRTTVATDATGQFAVALPDGTKIALGAQPDPRWGMDVPVPTPVDETRPDGVTRHTTTAIAVTAAPGDPLAVNAWSLTTDVAGSRWLEQADPVSRTITWSDPAGRATAQTYDTRGRLVSQTAPGQEDLALTYDDNGRIATHTSGSGATAATTTYTYGTDGILDITGPDGVVEHVTVDSVGRVVRLTAADGSAVLTTYDGIGRLVRIAPAGQPSTTIGLSPAGRQTGFLPPTVGNDGSYETRSYDLDGNAAAITGPGDRSVSVAYDQAGRVSGWQFDQGAATTAYDPTTGLRTGNTAPGGVGTSISYLGGVPVGTTVSGPVAGAVSVTLDGEGRVAAESVNGASPIPYTYDDAWLLTSVGDVVLQRDPSSGQLSQATLGVVRTIREYDAQGRPARIATTVGGSTAFDLRYGYDLRGRVTSVTETRAGGKPIQTTYAYDNVGRLATGSVDGTRVERDGYDSAGNRVAVESPSGKLEATYDERGQLQRWGAVTYASRPDGQLDSMTTGEATTSFTFDDFGALRAVTLPDGRRIEYLVDAGGARMAKKVDGGLVAGYLYAPDGRLAAQTDGGGAVVARFGYDDAGRLTLVERGNTRYQVVTDHLGSPLLVIDGASGKLAEAVAYDAWGAVTSDSNPGFIPIGFAGGLHDQDTGLVKFGAREYDPRTGRWTGPDPIRYAGGDAILYRYVAGDPVNATDPTGLYQPSKRSDREGPQEIFINPQGTGFIKCTGRRCREIDPKTGLPPGRVPPPAWTKKCLDPAACARFADGRCFLTCAWGGSDPHDRTEDGVWFDFQAAGEFLMVASADDSVVIQVRLEPFGSSTIATLGSAVAASVAGDRVAVYVSDTMPLTIDGETEVRSDFSVRLPHGGVVERHGSLVTIEWPNGSRLDVTRGRRWLDFAFASDAAIAPTLSGLLGSADGNPANDFTARDGTVIERNDPAFATRVYDPFGKSWRITQAESLFDYGPGQSTATFTKSDIPHGPATIDSLDAATRAKAEELCRAMGVATEPTLTNCIFDVGITGDSSYAASAAAVQVSTAGPLARSAGLGTGASLVVVAKASGVISKPSQVDKSTFSAKAGDVVYLDAHGACVTGLNWRLAAPSGTHLSLGHVCDDLGRFVLPDAGTYAVEVYTDDETATGAYSFEVIGAPPERISSISLGQTISDSTSWIGEWHRYTFDATAGQVVYLDGQGACVNGLLWRLVGPSRNLTLGHSCDDLGQVVLPEAGSYAVEVYADDTAAGPYTFELRSSK